MASGCASEPWLMGGGGVCCSDTELGPERPTSVARRSVCSGRRVGGGRCHPPDSPEWHVYWYHQQSKGANDARRIAQENHGDRCVDQFDTIVLLGFSNGGATAEHVAWKLRHRNVLIDLVITIDPIDHVWNWPLHLLTPFKRSPNAVSWINIYQRSDGVLKGHAIPGADHNVLLPGSFFPYSGQFAHRELLVVDNWYTYLLSSAALSGVPPLRDSWKYERE